MIPFFRKIRKKLADDNKPLKYMRYAIGEIVLVVIGILIALQINNWNQERKNNAKILSLFEEVQNDILRDIPNIESAISAYKIKDSLVNLVINNKLTRDDYKNLNIQDELFNLISYYVHFQFNTTGYNNLKLNVNDIAPIYKPVFDTITTLYEQTTKTLEIANSRIEEYVFDNIKDLSHKQEWFSSKEGSWASNDTVLDYFLHDPFYKNRVKEFRLLINDEFKTYKIEALIAFQILNEITQSDLKLPEHLKYYVSSAENLEPFTGMYKEKDSTNKRIMIINEKGMSWNDAPYIYIMTNEGNDRFGFKESLVFSLRFQRDNKGKVNGVNFTTYERIREFVKIDSKK
jgi:hypothetical protein